MKKLLLVTGLVFGINSFAQAADTQASELPAVCQEYFTLAEEWLTKQNAPAETQKQALEQLKAQFTSIEDKSLQSEACTMALKEIKAQLNK